MTELGATTKIELGELLAEMQRVEARLQQSLTAMESNFSKALELRLESETQRLTARIDGNVQGLGDDFAQRLQMLEGSFLRQLQDLQDRVSDLDAVHRTESKTRTVQIRARSDLSPTGNAFMERDADFAPPSIFAQ